MPDKTTQNGHLNAARQSLDECGLTLEQVSETCCTYERSPQMEGMFHELQKAREALEDGFKDPGRLSACVVLIAACSQRIEALKVSCCTETRDPLYNQILKDLKKAQEVLARAIGSGY